MKKPGTVFTRYVAYLVCTSDRYLSMYYGEVEVPKRASDGYENAPTLVGMADVYINHLGHVWNKKAREAVSASPRRRHSS